MRHPVHTCPACGEPLSVTELRCHGCGTTVRGDFVLCPLCRLTEEQTAFLRLFVQSRGNLRELERTLGISYPAVRAKLDELAQALEVGEPRDSPRWRRRRILEKVAQGEMAVAEALQRLEQLAADREGEGGGEGGDEAGAGG